MRYEDFLLECFELAPTQLKEVGIYNDNHRSWGRGEWEPVHDWNRSKCKTTKFILQVQWETGGWSGGNCWGGSAEPYSSREEPAELTELDNILEKFKPDLSYIQYRNLTNSLMETNSRTQHEYYGNCTDYSYKQIDLQKLYDYMKEKGWFDNEG